MQPYGRALHESKPVVSQKEPKAQRHWLLYSLLDGALLGKGGLLLPLGPPEQPACASRGEQRSTTERRTTSIDCLFAIGCDEATCAR